MTLGTNNNTFVVKLLPIYICKVEMTYVSEQLVRISPAYQSVQSFVNYVYTISRYKEKQICSKVIINLTFYYSY